MLDCGVDWFAFCHWLMQMAGSNSGMQYQFSLGNLLCNSQIGPLSYKSHFLIFLWAAMFARCLIQAA